MPDVSFNMLQKILVGPFGRSFLQDARTAGRPVFAWTVNEIQAMDWSIRHHLNGVITDDPKKYLEFCKNFDEKSPAMKPTFKDYLLIIWINILAALFSLLFRWRHGFNVDATKVKGSQNTVLMSTALTEDTR